ncbi:MAG: glycosyltransferase family 2 protein [Bacteroidota bacterium]
MPIDTQRTYLQKHRFAPRQLNVPPKSDLSTIVVIPTHREPQLLPTLLSLEQCQAPKGAVEIILVFNSSIKAEESIRQHHLQQIQEIERWAKAEKRQHSYFCLHFDQLPHKHAGVGLARKIGMDEAVDRFEQIERDGIIVCTDGDTTLADNYLVEVEAAFHANAKLEALGLDFEHPLQGEDYPEEVYRGIVQYELFLRYYIEGLRYAGFPYAFHTIGSAMVVRSSAYQKRGGMNRRKAGEDFYFLHKFIPEGRFQELNSTRVYPSPRPSDRVPFGTGRAISKYLAGDQSFYPTYDPRTFSDLKTLFDQIAQIYTNPPQHLAASVEAFCEAENFTHKLPELRANVRDLASFPKRFFQWFDALKVLKYVHFARDHFYPEVELGLAAADLWELRLGERLSLDQQDWLIKYRLQQNK